MYFLSQNFTNFLDAFPTYSPPIHVAPVLVLFYLPFNIAPCPSMLYSQQSLRVGLQRMQQYPASRLESGEEDLNTYIRAGKRGGQTTRWQDHLYEESAAVELISCPPSVEEELVAGLPGRVEVPIFHGRLSG